MKTYTSTKAPYSLQFLEQLSGDMRMLAQDFMDCGGSVDKATRLHKAAAIVDEIRRENSKGRELEMGFQSA